MHNIQLEHKDHQASGVTIPLCFLVHDMDVPMNVGSLFRIADAFGVEKVYLSGSSIVPPNAKLKKTSRSTEKYVKFAYQKDPLEIVGNLKGKGYKMAALEITSSSQDIRKFEVPPDAKICLMVGSENKGVDQALLDQADFTLHIPMLGQNSSLNVATATAIATFELFKGVMP